MNPAKYIHLLKSLGLLRPEIDPLTSYSESAKKINKTQQGPSRLGTCADTKLLYVETLWACSIDPYEVASFSTAAVRRSAYARVCVFVCVCVCVCVCARQCGRACVCARARDSRRRDKVSARSAHVTVDLSARLAEDN